MVLHVCILDLNTLYMHIFVSNSKSSKTPYAYVLVDKDLSYLYVNAKPKIYLMISSRKNKYIPYEHVYVDLIVL